MSSSFLPLVSGMNKATNKHDGKLMIPKVALATYYESAYQAGHCWAQATTASIELPSPSEWGLNKNTDGEAREVHWTTLLEATQACRELIRCGCKKGCMQRMLQVIERYSRVHCTLICFCGELCGD